MADPVQPYTVTPDAGEFVAGILHGGAGTTIRLTDAQARYELLLGSIVPDGTPIVVEPPAGPISALDRMALTRGGKAWDAAVGELLAFLLTRILPEVTDTLDDVEGRILGTAAAADNTLGKLATRIATLAEAVQGGLDLKAPRLSPDFQGEPTAPTAPAGANNARLANTNFVATAITALALGSASRANTGTAAGNVPVLDAAGKLLASILPALAITDTYEVASQAAMLALTAERGDVAVRSDLSRCFILKAEPASTLENWVELKTPADVVQAVAGLTGTITAAQLRVALALATGDVSGLDTALGNRVRFDAAQALTAAQVTQALTNLGVSFAALRSFLTATTAASARQQIGLGSTDSVEFSALSINGGVPWTSVTAPGSIAADAGYAIQRFPSGEAIIKGTSVVTLDANGRAVVNVGLTAAAGTWLGMTCNGDFGVSKAQAIPGLNTSTGFTVEFQGAANATVRVNWLAWGRWK